MVTSRAGGSLTSQASLAAAPHGHWHRRGSPSLELMLLAGCSWCCDGGAA